MAKIVGMSRNIKLQWLNKVSEWVLEGLTENEIKEMLNEYLSYEIKSPTNLRKTREILMNIWVYSHEDKDVIKQNAIEIIRQTGECPLIVHWCMMLLAYPVFSDMCKLIGKFSEFQNVITLSQLKQKLYDEWGERTTLHHSIDKLVASLKDFGVLICEKPGKYTINTLAIKQEYSVSLMLITIMQIEKKSYYSLQELNNTQFFFPFEYKVSKEFIHENEKFIFNNFGGDLYVMMKE